MFHRWILGIVAVGFGALSVVSPVRAQAIETFGIGASVSAVNSVNHGFHLDRFDTRDWSGWLQYQLESGVVLRGTFGSLDVRGYNGQQNVTLTDGTTAKLPDLQDRIRYGLVSVSYDFRERGWTSGIFAGAGAYGIDPDSTDPAFESFRDKKETVWGLHAGLDADVRVWRGISVLGRITLHVPHTKPQRRILTAGAGLLYRF